MWFNILKNEGRRAAYRLFINSMVHLGELIPPKSEPRTKTTQGSVTFYYFESSNGHFQFRATYIGDRLDSFNLFDAPPDVKPYIDYIEGMFEQEYPEQYAALQDFFKENAPATEEADTLFGIPTKKKLMRKIMLDWKNYMDHIIAIILQGVDNIGINMPVAPYKRLLERDIHTSIPYKEVRDYVVAGPGLETEDFPLATIRAIQATYAKALRDRNPDIVWENFINFIAHFRRNYTQLLYDLASSGNNINYDNIFSLREDAVPNVSYTDMVTLARNVWANNPNDVETLMRQLPDYN